MANQKYTQVIDLLAAGRFNWQSDNILGVLLRNAAFAAGDTKLSQLAAPQVATTQIQGRVLASGGNCLGYPAFFNTVPGNQDYQMVLVQNLGDGDPNLLAYFDTNAEAGPLRLDAPGTLVVRPVALTPVNPDVSESARLWMRL